jgi:hypothetical protein
MSTNQPFSTSSSSKPIGLQDSLFYENSLKKTKENSNSHSINKSPINLNSNYQPGNNEYVDRPIPILNNHYNQTHNNGFNTKAVNINANYAHSALDSHSYNQQMQQNAMNNI